jgi:hypothetical protein
VLDAVSLMPKRSKNNTGTNVHKSDTTVKEKLIPRYFPTIDTRFLYDLFTSSADPKYFVR